MFFHLFFPDTKMMTKSLFITPRNAKMKSELVKWHLVNWRKMLDCMHQHCANSGSKRHSIYIRTVKYCRISTMYMKKQKIVLHSFRFDSFLPGLGSPCCSAQTASKPVRTSSAMQTGAKGQLILKANSNLFIWTKNQHKYFCISALASKSGQIKKI